MIDKSAKNAESERVQTSVYFPRKVYESLSEWSDEEQRSISNLVSIIVTKAVERRARAKERDIPS
jgi:hypothetical protein